MTTPIFASQVLKTSVGLSFELKKRFKMIENGLGELERKDDELKFRKDFEEFAKMIPNWKGKVVVIGYVGKDSSVIDLVSSEGSLRTKFKGGLVEKNGESITRYKWYKSLLYSDVYSKIKVQMIS